MLKQETKEALLAFVSEHASDEELLNMSIDIKNRRQREANALSTLNNYLGIGPAKAKPKVEAAPVVEQSAAPVEPPGTAVSRIGADTKALILRHLAKGPDTVTSIAVVIKRNQAQAADLLKYLWVKKAVTYTGDRYAAS